MKNYLCLSASDLHGNILHYEKIKQIVLDQKISFVFFCGDLLPTNGVKWSPESNTRTIQNQKDFIKEYFLDYLDKLSKYSYVYAIFGNDDFKSNFIYLKKVNDKVFFLNNQVVRLHVAEQDLFVAGYPYVSLTPFLHKDWEKWDSSSSILDHKIYKTEGYISNKNQHLPISFLSHQDGLSTIADDLENLAQKCDPKRTIFIIHEPPFDTPLDVIAKDNKFIKDGITHIGSKSVRKFIEKYQPLLTMHGHIHETFRESGNFMWKCGSSLSFTAANDYTLDSVAYILFTLPDLKLVKRFS